MKVGCEPNTSCDAAFAGWPGEPAACKADAVKVGSVCMDRYEASVWQVPATNPRGRSNKGLITEIQNGTAKLTDLSAGGATQISPSLSCAPGFPGTFPVNGQWTAGSPLYAKSYFASVEHEVLFGLLARRIGDCRLLGLLVSLLEHGATEVGRGMPIGNLTSQLFANLYLDPLDHFVKERLRVRHHVRYMDDFVLLSADQGQARRQLATVREFLGEQLRLQLNPRRVVIAPLSCPADFVGYVHHLDGRVRVRRRSVRRLWRRIKRLQWQLVGNQIDGEFVQASLASRFGLAKHADAFRLSRAIFSARDVHNIGKRLLVQTLASGSSGW